ncbi:MAG: sporulation transcriptional regulator SpoIIID [Clostridia bacterium]|nr:sporulation transcriptional regulator SpoIIID [Clostridia bacterium]
MRDDTEKRAVELGRYIVRNASTVRSAAKMYDVSKSTVFTDVSKRLERIDYDLYLEVKSVLELNKAQRHIRGGEATREKYRELKK